MTMPTFALAPCSSPLSKSSFKNSDLSVFPTSKTTSSSLQPQSNTTNRHSFPTFNPLWQQHQFQMQEHQREHQRQDEIYLEKSTQSITTPSTPSFKPVPNRPRLSLDTSRELLGNITVIQHGDKSYLKLFSPILVESPVSFLNETQQLEDKKKWEDGPDEAFQRQLEMERREVFKVRSKQQLRGFIMGLWLGCLIGLVVVQQTASKVYIPSHLARRETSPLLLFVILMSCLAVIRSGTRSMMTAIATSTAVVTCFATLVMNQSRYSTEFHAYRAALQARS
ncbi:hypothetical protein EMPS_00730 [Entomortierella parvispora]|uniref:Transmembrane protein n=1 Tax=Entomortierella parvispora TaxID=205924 RepID=A0A9P3H1J5_9FUNG|nr:hypothetical protein EMPS_00730 [Entomortierella parvispora]